MSSKMVWDQLKAIVYKELRIYFNSPIAYIFVTALLGFSFWLFFRNFFIAGQVEMRSFFELLPWIYLLMLPALTMRLWSEEERQGTIETLLTMSIPLPLIVIAKFLASMIFLLFTLGATLVLPISLSFLGNLDWGAVFVAYLGALMIGGCYIALGLMISGITNNQIVSFIITVLGCFILYILAQPIVTYSLPDIALPVINVVSFGAHYESITRGVIDSRDMIYFVTFIAFMLYVNTQLLYSKR